MENDSFLHDSSSTTLSSESGLDMPLDNRALAAAAERRIRQQREQPPDHPTDFDENHEKRQQFRRMIDPGILRPNPMHIALEALQTLLTLAENILSHPDEVKYQRFKPTNSKIKKSLVEPKGTLEFAVALGFNPQVEDLQPFYVWNKRRVQDLRIGASILKEALEREAAKMERDLKNKQQETAAAEAEKLNIRQAFLDDRKSRLMRDQRERAQRAAATSRQSSESPASSDAPFSPMPGTGVTLSGTTSTGHADPPAYDATEISD